jgi:hypothetical protein
MPLSPGTFHRAVLEEYGKIASFSLPFNGKHAVFSMPSYESVAK